ncbi:MAG: CBS domain-containing protein [Magnetococcales bacterium]|nr:CBS domain-containing protein [Magnetococcales bacterium]
MLPRRLSSSSCPNSSHSMKRVLNRNDFVAPILNLRLRDLDWTKPVILDGGTSIREAAHTMSGRKLDLVLVRQGDRHGLLTSADMRDALAIEQVGVDTPIATIMSWKLVVLSPDASLFKAFLVMTRRGVNRMVIVGADGDVIGTLALHELLSFLTNHASLTIQRIHQATTIAELADAVKHQGGLVQTLFSSGIKVRHIGWLMHELDRQVFQQAATLLANQELLQRGCILVLGSEGRGEQFMKTDQDNAFIAGDDVPVARIREFCQIFTEALLRLGYPECPGKVMMNNPLWGSCLGQFREKVQGWIDDPSPGNLLRIAIFYDASAVVGNTDLFRRLRRSFMARLPGDQAFYSYFAMPVLAFETPLGIFKRFIVEKGSREGRIDLKKGAIFPLVHGVRSLALEYRLKDTNTARRIRGLVRLGVLEQSFAVDLIDAFDVISGLRVKASLDCLRGDGGGGDLLELESLGSLERESLRDSLAQVDRFKQRIDHHFRLSQLR